MAQHDQRFKVLLQEFLAEFFALFFPEWHGRFDFTKADFLQQELFTDPPRGEKVVIDLVVKLPILYSTIGPRPHEPTHQTVLIHIEIEADDKVEPLRERMYDYYHYLTRKHDLDVLPIAVYLRVGLEGRGIDAYERNFWERRPLRFEYDYVGLPALPGEEYLSGANALGVALSTLMRMPRERRAPAAAEALERIVLGAETPQRKRLLCECIQAYAPLDDSQRIELDSLLNEPKRIGVQTVGKTWTEIGYERGLQEGKKKSLQLLLERHFQKTLSETALQRLAGMSPEQLDQLFLEVLTAQSLQELGLED